MVEERAQGPVVLELYRSRLSRTSGEKVDPSSDAPLSTGGGDGTSGGMERVWEKLAEHDRRFDRIETALDRVGGELSNAKFWFVGTTAGIVLAGLGLVYSARQDTTATISAALTAIQTALAARPPEAPAASAPQPTVIVVPLPQPSPTPPVSGKPPETPPAQP